MWSYRHNVYWTRKDLNKMQSKEEKTKVKQMATEMSPRVQGPIGLRRENVELFSHREYETNRMG